MLLSPNTTVTCLLKRSGDSHDGDVEVCGRDGGNVRGVDGNDGMLGNGDGGDVGGCASRCAFEDHLSGFKGERCVASFNGHGEFVVAVGRVVLPVVEEKELCIYLGRTM